MSTKKKPAAEFTVPPCMKNLTGPEIAIRLGGGLKSFSGLLNCTPQAVMAWKKNGVPKEHRRIVSALTMLPEEKLAERKIIRRPKARELEDECA